MKKHTLEILFSIINCLKWSVFKEILATLRRLLIFVSPSPVLKITFGYNIASSLYAQIASIPPTITIFSLKESSKSHNLRKEEILVEISIIS